MSETLFDLMNLPEQPAMSDAERKRMKRRAYERPAGHAAPIGTGPSGETCKTCRHIANRGTAKIYYKCRLNEAKWTASRHSDIRVSDAACRKWKGPDTL